MNEFQINYFNAIVGAFEGFTYVCSSENIIEYVNNQVIDKIGLDITGQYCFKALHGLDEICPWCKDQDVFKDETTRWEYKNPKTGRWYLYMSSPVYNPDGSVSKLTLCTDITKTKTAELLLKESERKLQTLMGNLPGMVYRCKADETHTMEFASEGCYPLLGYKPSELIGKGSTSFQRLIHPDDRSNLINCLNTALEEKRSYSFIYRIKKASGEIIWVWEQGVGLFSNSEKLIALEGFITNITEQKQAELDLRKENTKLKFATKNRYKLGNLVGKSAAMQNIYDLILKASSNDVHVIIYGESGTGKELVAQCIHELSDRRTRPFVAVNCGAINENLIESEFFGYKKGAFTGGAVTGSMGYLDRANGGSLFLDELGEMSLNMQVKLLRAIESKGYIPVGSNQIKTSDFRIIAATNRDLVEAVNNKKMREDFYYRIHIFPIYMPPLRERKEDIPLLIEHFTELFSKKFSKEVTIPIDLVDSFMKYEWPGNIRELQNSIYRYMSLGKRNFTNERFNVEKTLSKSDDETLINIPPKGLNDIVAQFEKKVILTALEKHQWNRGKTADFLNIDRKTLYRKIKTLETLIPE
ncbi:sigma-54 interaction domain-containing protein [Desulfocicer niacini]